MKGETVSKLFLADDTTIIIELHPNEIALIKALRNNWRFGEITILVRDGIPYRLRRVQEFIDLTGREDKDIIKE